MQQNNLFSHCPKELVTDGFLAWLFNFMNNQSLEARRSLFDLLFSNNGSSFQDISNIWTERQKEGVDLFVHFDSKDIQHTVLFENKTWSRPHGNQLARYKDLFPNCHKYIYLKLAFIPYCEHVEAKNSEYNVITSNQLLNVINPLRDEHPFIKEYCEYLTNQFVTPLRQLEAELFKQNNLKKLEDSQGQQFILSELEEKLTQQQIPDLAFNVGSNRGGSPWTQLDIAKRKAMFGNEDEFITWRIDMRSERYYIRLNQWAGIDEDFRQQKISRLHLLRNECQLISNRYGWKAGELSERGLKESEIAIFFLDENPLSIIRNDLKNFSLDFIKAYSKI